MAAAMTADNGMVLKALTPLLAKIGFRKRAGEIFTVDLSNDVVGWLGLNRATKHRPSGEVEINPVVGVRHQEVERLVAELRGEKAHAYVPSTITTPIGYVMPEARYRAWIFAADRADAVATEMVAAIAEHGLAFMQAHKDLKDICRALEPRSKLAVEDSAMYRRPVAWFVDGDARRAAEDIDKSLAAIGDRGDMAANDFRRFAAALRVERAKQAHRAIRDILLRWDPIGVAGYPEAQDEYDAYVGEVYRLLSHRADRNEVFKYLWWLETEHMALCGDRQRTEKTAEELVALLSYGTMPAT